GDRTFLWDFPEFLPLPKRANRFHIGPISFEGWPYDSVDLNPLLKSDYPLAVVSFGTCVTNSATVARITRLLLELGYKVLIAAGGQAEMAAIKLPDSSVYVVKFAPLHKIFPYTSLLVTHGGQMTVFEALQNKVPVLVIPLQPEQAHNGVCLERIGCGARLIPSTHFTGFPEDYIRAFNQINDEKITATIKELVMDSHTKNNLTKIHQVLEHYHGAETLANFLSGAINR
ncbi:MAG TPA: glycosyl transferase, partial [Firmicutes bacterium]|nr:glycosyl transferase [Bacillota bacterium]